MHGIMNVVSNRSADVSLLALLGKVQNRQVEFLLDSGASGNFIAKSMLEDFGLDWDLVRVQEVRLADGKCLKTCGKIDLTICFGDFTYTGMFFILQENVPTILGMSFFRDVQPRVQWRAGKVFVGNVSLPVCCFGMTKRVARVQQAAVSSVDVVKSTNSFSELAVVDDDVQPIPDTLVPLVTPIVQQTEHGMSSEICVQKGRSFERVQLNCKCSTCGKKLPNGVAGAQCAKCANRSMTHQFGQLVDACGSVVSLDDVTVEKSADVAAEIVPLKQFVRAGKRGHYLNFGVCVLDTHECARVPSVADVSAVISNHQQQVAKSFGGVEMLLNEYNLLRSQGFQVFEQQCNHCGAYHKQQEDSAVGCKHFKCNSCMKQFASADVSGTSVCLPLANVFNQCVETLQLNFTHRHAHGGDGDANVQHGTLSDLAVSELNRLKVEFPEVFKTPVFPVQRSVDVFEHKIPLIDESAPAPKRRLYPLDATELAELKTQISELLDSNRIEPSNGPYGAPILFAKKKDGRLRMCIDYRLLNAQTRNDAFPLPRIDELLCRLDGAAVFSKLDLRDGYHQVPMYAPDRVKTAFTCRYGTYQFTVMPFGLMTAPSTFQRMMNHVFFELLDRGVVVYLDDVLIYSRDVASHKKLLNEVFALLAKHKLYLKDTKCHLYLERVAFLGHVIDCNGVSMEQGKLDAVQKWPEPQNVQQVQQFLGLCNYYRKFVLRFSEIASPLTLLTRKGQPFVWSLEQQRSFDALKTCLCSSPTLKLFDSQCKTRVVCDASNTCVGAVLEQQDVKSLAWHPVEYYSKRLSAAERNYSATDREFVAIRQALERWRHFLIGSRFVILTDHAALTYLTSSVGVHRRNVRWLEFLSQFDFEIQHIRGRENVVADTLSRVPGSEILTQLELCSLDCTLGVVHSADLPAKCTADYVCTAHPVPHFITGIISINERDSFRDQLLREQRESAVPWFVELCARAVAGDTVFQYRNELLCKLVNDHFCPVIPDWQSSTVQVILSDLHSSALGGHLGRKKLLVAVQKRFYFQKMYQVVDAFCKACLVCQKNKTSTQKPVGLLQPLENPTRCFDHISMDFVVQLPTSSGGSDAIFTIVDRFSRMVRFIPMSSSASASDVAQLFFDHWLCRFGVPSKIICDRDVKFQSIFWKSLCSLLGSRIAMSTAYHPQTDGLTERMHRSLEQILRCFCSTAQSSWCSLLSQSEFALNSTIAASHQMSPFEVVFGFTPSLPLDLSFGVASHAVEDLFSARSRAHSQVKKLLAESSESMKRAADEHRRPSELAVGDSVLLSTAHLPLKAGTRKLAEKWTGPFVIEERVAAEAWRLQLPGTWRVHPVFHSSQLKLARGQSRVVPPIALESEEVPEYEVERVLASRLVRGTTEYLVRWRGYGQFDDTWEPAANLSNAQDCIAEFLARGPGGSRRQRV